MLRILAGVAAALLIAGSAHAGELDKEFVGKKALRSANVAKALQTPNTDKAIASEMDTESPDQAARGWRGGHRGYGWGGYRGGWGGYRGYGWGGYYRPWGYGYGYGWNRRYWGGPYVNFSVGYPAYYDPYYSYYPYAYSSYYY